MLEHDNPGVLMAEIDIGEVDSARARIPAWSLEPKI
jgi:predicted amidohydrolase